MDALRDVGTTTLAWRPAKGEKGAIELYAGEKVYATLYQERKQQAVAVTAEGRWTIHRERGTVTVRGDDSTVAATFSSERGGEGMLTLADGQTFRWVGTRRGTAERAFCDASGKRVIRFWKDWQFFRVTDRAEADLGSAGLPALPLLVVMGRYIGIGMDDDMTAVIIMSTGS